MDQVRSTPLRPDQVIGSYRVIRTLGRGGIGAVYEVEHTKLGVRYAMKTFALQEGNVEFFRRRFSAEGKILARLNHPNLVRVIDLEIDENLGVLYFVMDLVLCEDGETRTLADIEPGGVGEDQVFEWFREMCDALSYIHANGIVHRDIKLNNILLANDGHVVLSDFGISKVSDEKMRADVDMTRTMVSVMVTGEHFMMGTPGYIAPEIRSGQEATAASDVYSLGVAFFRLLTNIWYDPSLAPNKVSDRGRTMTSVKLLESFEYRWVDVLPTMLNENPADRPLVLSDLSARLLPGREDDAKPKRRAWIMWMSASVLAAVLVGAGLRWCFSSKSEVLPFDDLYAIPRATPET